MKGVELYGQVRRAVYVEGLSRREAARRFGIDPRTVAKNRFPLSRRSEGYPCGPKDRVAARRDGSASRAARCIRRSRNAASADT